MQAKNMFMGQPSSKLSAFYEQFALYAGEAIDTLTKLKMALPRDSTPQSLSSLLLATSKLASFMETATETKRKYFRLSRDAHDSKQLLEDDLAKETSKLLYQYASEVRPLRTSAEKEAYISDFRDSDLQDRLKWMTIIAAETSKWYGIVSIECDRIRRTRDAAAMIFKIAHELYNLGGSRFSDREEKALPSEEEVLPLIDGEVKI